MVRGEGLTATTAWKRLVLWPPGSSRSPRGTLRWISADPRCRRADRAAIPPLLYGRERIAAVTSVGGTQPLVCEDMGVLATEERIYRA